MWILLGDYGKVLCFSENEFQQNSNASSIFHEYSLSCGRFIAFTFDLCLCLSFVNNS